MATIFTLPGIGGSGADHWQTLWERADPAIVRIEQTDWDRPDLAGWTARAAHTLASGAPPALLVAHSLGCLLIPHLADVADLAGGRIAGALLVCPPDPAAAAFPSAAASFAQIPDRKLPFPSLLVSSTNDPYGTPAHARRLAGLWGGGLVVLEGLGHINAESRVGDWTSGRNLLRAFAAGLGLPDTLR